MISNAQHKTGPAWWQTAMLSLVGATLLAACGVMSSSTSGSPTGSPSAPAGTAMSGPAAMCAQIAPIRAALGKLSHVTIRHASADQIATEVTTIRARIAALSGQAGVMSSQATRLTTGLEQVGKDARAAGANPSPMNIKKLSSAVTAVKVKVRPTLAEIDAICPH